MPLANEMDELKFFGGLAVIAILVIGVLVYFGRKLSHAAERNAECIDLPLYITRTGTAFFACVVAFWVSCAAVRILAPISDFGRYLGTFDGAAAVILGSTTFVAVAWLIFDKLGFPLAKWTKDSDSG